MSPILAAQHLNWPMYFIFCLRWIIPSLFLWSISARKHYNNAKTSNNYNSVIANKIDTRGFSVLESAGGPSGKYDARQVIVVAGNFSLDGEIVNIAQYEISSGM